MKKFLALLLALTMALALVACGGGDDAASDTTADSGDDAAASTGEFEEMTWKFACSATETSPWVDGAKEFARIVGEKTGGAITVQYYTADQLTAGNQTGNVCHIYHEVCIYALCDFCECREINRSGISRSAGQDHLRSARQRFFTHILHIDVASFVHIVEYHIV